MKTTTSVKIDQSVKAAAAKLAGQMGLTLSAVINSSLREFVNSKKIVFQIHPVLNTKTQKRLLLLSRDVRNKKNLIGPFNNPSDVMKSLKS